MLPRHPEQSRGMRIRSSPSHGYHAGMVLSHGPSAALRTRADHIVRTMMDPLPDRWYLKVNFLLRMHRVLDLRHPRTYSEKIQWLKLYGGLEQYSSYTDKYEARQYVSDVIGAEHLVPLLGVWDAFDQIPFDQLPSQFALKATHGQGYNFLCRDKSRVNLAWLRRTVTKWMRTNFYRVEREAQYRAIHPRLIVEQYLQDESGALRDYKFPCFDGVPAAVQVIGDRATGATENYYDLQWNLLPVEERGFPNTGYSIPRPPLLDDMIDVAARLSAEFPFVRVDLYCTGQSIYFGELTFTPASGLITYEPSSYDLELGSMLDLARFTAVTPAVRT